MNIYIKFDITQLCKIVVQDVLDKMEVPYTTPGLNEIEFKKDLSATKLNALKKELDRYGIEVLDDQKTTLIQKIKDTIIEMVWNDEDAPNVTTSTYLSKKLHHSYGYLSNLFSEVTFSSIEGFIILQKVERAKQLLVSEAHTLTEISYILNYSSVAHLSNQFKKTTGLTPSAFQRIIKARKKLN